MGSVRTYGSVHAICDVRGCGERAKYMVESGYYVCKKHKNG